MLLYRAAVVLDGAEITGLIKNRLKPLRYRPDLLNGLIAEVGLMSSNPA
ncbi:hypothetical protein [Streptosporangium sp. NPDC006007]